MRKPTAARPLLLFALLTIASLTAPAAFGQKGNGSLVGRVVDADTHEPIGFAQVLLVEAERSAGADEKGVFRIISVPEGKYAIKSYRIGYDALEQTVSVTASDTARITLHMQAAPLLSGSVLVTAEHDDAGRSAASLSLGGRDLRRHLGTTIAESLEDQPGVAMRSMGPAPARPVLRGLGGERLLVLQDGGRTGDLSATSSDHAVVIDPMTADRIDVVRGPAALQFGANALGGVVNVVRGTIPYEQLRTPVFSVGVQGQSVSSGLATGVSAEVPLGNYAVRADGSYRNASDVHTPEGVLGNTALQTFSGAIGATRFSGHNHMGAAFTAYASNYGIPGGFVGAHPGGVDIEIHKLQAEVRGGLHPHQRWVERLEVRGLATNYFHQEFEKSGRVGVEFGVLSAEGSLTAFTNKIGPFSGGAAGVWVSGRRTDSGGYSFTPATTERTAAAFTYLQTAAGPATLQIGGRAEGRIVTPDEEEVARIGHIRRRTFGGIALSASATLPLGSAWATGGSLMRSIRMPGIEELFSEGPHLAAYSFEVGNPDLKVEKGVGGEVFLRHTGERARGTLTLFASRIARYIYPMNTGRLNFSVLLPEYQFTGADVLMAGAEVSASAALGRAWRVLGSGSYVRGSLAGGSAPLPMMPPGAGRLELQRDVGVLTLGIAARSALRQDRLAEFETPTDGYLVWDASAQFHRTAGDFLHTVDFSIENLTDAVYRDHLSRVRVIMPEPGINVRLLYRVHF